MVIVGSDHPRTRLIVPLNLPLKEELGDTASRSSVLQADDTKSLLLFKDIIDVDSCAMHYYHRRQTQSGSNTIHFHSDIYT